MASSSDAAPARLATAVKLGWAAGTAGTVTLLYLVNLFLLFFLTDLLGLDPAAAGLILFGVRLYDMVTDPLVGLASDRLDTRWGRRRPWMLAGAGLSALSCVLIFAPPAAVTGSTWLAVYMGIALVCYFTGYTAFNVPYLAMPAEMCGDYHERTSLMSYRVFFVAVSGVLATAAAPALVEALGGDLPAYRGMAFAMSALVLFAMLTAVTATRGARFTTRDSGGIPLRESLRALGRNRPLLLLIAVKFLQLFALAASSASLLFVVKYVLQRAEATAGLYGLVMSGATIASLPLWLRIARRLPKHRVFAVATVGQALLTLSWLVAGPDETLAVFCLRALGLGVCSAGIILMGQSLLPDVIDFDYRLTGSRREGLLASLYSFVEKTSFAVSPLVIGPFLAYMGYEPGFGEAGAPAARVITAFYVSIAVLPASGYLLSIPLLLRYRLTAETLAGQPEAVPLPRRQGA